MVLAACAVLLVCLPSIGFADPEVGHIGAELSSPHVLSAGELAALIALGFIPALVMIARARRDERRDEQRPSG